MKSTRSRLITISLTLLISHAAAQAETDVGGSQIPAARAHFDNAARCSERADYNGAIQELTEAIKIDPKYGKAYGNRAAARLNAHDYKGCIADINVALKYFPNMPSLVELRTKSETAMQQSSSQAIPQQNRAAANRLLQQALLGGDLADPSTLIMMQAQRAGLTGNTQRSPMVNPFAQHPLVAAQTSLTNSPIGNSVPNGIGQNDRTGQTDRTDPLSTTNLSEKLAAMTSSAEPIPRVPQDSGNQAQSNSSPSYERGCQKLQAQDFPGAIAEFDQVIAVNPKFGDAYANRGLARLRTNDPKGALSDFETADKLIPNNDQLKNMIMVAKKLIGQ